jgi:hypothetical protein
MDTLAPLAEAEDCGLIAKLATDPKKRADFSRLSAQLRATAQDIKAMIAARSAG